jgi:hypothetical protein
MPKETQPEYMTDLIVPLLEPIIDIRYSTIFLRREDITKEQKKEFFLRGFICREPEIPIPGEFIIHSIE